MFVRVSGAPDSASDQGVRVVFATPIPLHVANMLRRAIYSHAPVWAFEAVEVKHNPFHHVVPSELVEEKMKHLVLRCARPAQMHVMRGHTAKASIRPIPASAKSIKGTDIVFKSATSYASANPALEFGVSVWPLGVEISNAFQAPPAATAHGTVGATRNAGLDATLDAIFASAFDVGDASQRYAASNCRFEFSPSNDEMVTALVYTARGHYASPDLVFVWGVQRMHDHLNAIEEAFVAHATAAPFC